VAGRLDRIALETDGLTTRSLRDSLSFPIRNLVQRHVGATMTDPTNVTITRPWNTAKRCSATRFDESNVSCCGRGVDAPPRGPIISLRLERADWSSWATRSWGRSVCELLFLKYPDYLEGELTRIKSVVVSRRTCAKISQKLGFDEFLVLGKGMGRT